jgi:L,D-transpeptidase ErfK/SrfK
LLLTQIVGGEFVYTVQQGDSLTSIGARFGVDVSVLAKENELKAASRLKPAQTLKIDNRHIVSLSGDSEIVINVPQRMLFHFADGRLTGAYPIAAGKPGWRTPIGTFEILTLEEHPTWDVPVSIQEEMRKSGKPVVTRIPPSPENPLGEYWSGLSMPGLGIHGTNAPSSIYRLSTHGCIRLHPEDIRSVFDAVDIGTQGRIIYEAVLIARQGESIFVEIHPDSYKRQSDPLRKVLDIARSEGFLELLDISAVQQVLRNQEGVARDVTRR